MADRGLLIKEGRADLMTGAVLMGENLMVGKTGAEFCPPRGSLPGCQVGLGMPWLLLGVSGFRADAVGWDQHCGSSPDVG